MKCPVLFLARPDAEMGLSSEHDCLEKKCAWWDYGFEHCAILSLAVSLDLIDDKLENIQSKMPTEAQFRK